ncbi:unnamed protein product, partial [Amoebophrya sp. A25]
GHLCALEQGSASAESTTQRGSVLHVVLQPLVVGASFPDDNAKVLDAFWRSLSVSAQAKRDEKAAKCLKKTPAVLANTHDANALISSGLQSMQELYPKRLQHLRNQMARSIPSDGKNLTVFLLSDFHFFDYLHLKDAVTLERMVMEGWA